jgi:DNA modification methylase
MNRQLINGDCLEELKKLDDNSVDLLCTDPPYGYGFMGKHWDTFKEKDSTKSQQVGWMSPGMKKDTYGMKEFFDPIWKECLRVLKPGALAFVMSAPRSDVQTIMAQTLRDAGFDISFTPIYWTYASGFPKAMNVSKMIDKQKGAKREVIGKNPNHRESEALYELGFQGGKGDGNIVGGAVSDEAKKLDGSYGGFQPKPAVEVVLVAMKPIEEKGLLAQALKNGKAVSWFDDCRIPFEEGHEPSDNQSMPDLRDVGKKSKEAIGIDKLSYGQVENAERKEYEQNSDGRFPANLLVSDEALNDYSKFFSLDSWFEENLKSLPEPVQQTFPFMIVPKASKSEKNDGLDNFDTKQTTGGGGGVGDYIDDVNSASGKFGSEKAPSRNIHPTVKPLTLMNYLVVLGSRKGDVVLEPFAGSGTTALACVSQERDYIAIEREEEYYEIAKARLDKLEQPLKMWDKFS